ncbi:MAG: 6-bladed beta-propeller [Draconibacterium sp.]
MQKYTLIILLVFLTNCQNKKENEQRFTQEQISSLKLDNTKILKINSDSMSVIDLNPFLGKQSFDFGSLVKEVKLIPLETTDKGLLDDIRKVLLTDTHIYVHDNFLGGGIVVFDSQGKFVKRITAGKGPGELFRLFDIDFDKENDELIAYQHSFLLHYTPLGEFIRQERLPFGAYNFSVTLNGYVFKVLEGGQGNVHLGTFEKYTLIVTDKNFKLVSAGIPKSLYATTLGASQLLFNNSTLNITHHYTDTIFQYNEATNRLTARYLLEYGKKRLPDMYLRGTNEQFKRAINNNDYYFFLGQYNHTYSHDVVYLDNWFEKVRLVVYRDKESGNLIGGTTANFDSNEMPPMAFPSWTSGNYFISAYYPNGQEPFIANSTIICDEDKLKLKDLTENDNPVLVLFKLRNF